MLYVLYTLHVVICIFLILVVLLQQGKGADLSVFGGGSTQTAFGARGATTLLHKLTVTSFVVFIATTMLIGIFESSSSGSLMSEAMEERQEDMLTPEAGETPLDQPAEEPMAPLETAAPDESAGEPPTE